MKDFLHLWDCFSLSQSVNVPGRNVGIRRSSQIALDFNLEISDDVFLDCMLVYFENVPPCQPLKPSCSAQLGF